MYQDLHCTIHSRRLTLKSISAADLFVKNWKNPTDHYVTLLRQTWHVKFAKQLTARNYAQVLYGQKNKNSFLHVYTALLKSDEDRAFIMSWTKANIKEGNCIYPKAAI